VPLRRATELATIAAVCLRPHRTRPSRSSSLETLWPVELSNWRNWELRTADNLETAGAIPSAAARCVATFCAPLPGAGHFVAEEARECLWRGVHAGDFQLGAVCGLADGALALFARFAVGQFLFCVFCFQLAASSRQLSF